MLRTKLEYIIYKKFTLDGFNFVLHLYMEEFCVMGYKDM
jgi:hypothetical protein